MTTAMIGMAAAVLLGAVVQRATGMGFALLAAPFLVLFLDPLNGIIITNVCGVASAGVVLTRVWRDLDRQRAKWLVPTGLLGCLPGALAVRMLPLSWLGLVVGLMVLVALLISLLSPSGRLNDTPAVRVTSGFCSGFMNVTAGVGGPALAIYGRGIGWEHRRFAATAQLQFFLVGAFSLLTKFHLPAFPLVGWIMLLVALVLGMIIGEKVAGRLHGATAMRLVMGLALAGTLVALGRAITTLLG